MVADQRYHLKAGQGFLIEPDTLTFYCASQDNPWTYVWVGFSGQRAPEYLYHLGFNHNHLVFQSSESCRIQNLVFVEKQYQLPEKRILSPRAVL